jgi:hypothetical protein
MPVSDNPVRAQWQRVALQALPPEDAILRRNVAITRYYAQWYSQPPHLFKWAGAAAFSSHRVGVLLAAYDYTVTNGVIRQVSKVFTDIAKTIHSHGDPETVVADLELIRQTNNLVFEDIGWAHLAYADPKGGIAAVESGLQDEPDCELLLKGFREIEKGRVLLASGPAKKRQAETHFWKGNTLLLKHEQYVIVQSQFDKMAPGMKLFLSLMTFMDFDLEGFRFLSWSDLVQDAHNLWWLTLQALGHHPTYTSFIAYMQTDVGAKQLAKTRAAADITKIAQRWAWAQHEVLAIWKYIEGNDPQLAQKMQRIMQGPLL